MNYVYDIDRTKYDNVRFIWKRKGYVAILSMAKCFNSICDVSYELWVCGLEFRNKEL